MDSSRPSDIIPTLIAVVLMLLIVTPAIYFEHFKGRGFWEGFDDMIHDPDSEEDEEDQYATREIPPRKSPRQNDEGEGEEEEYVPLGERVNRMIREVLPWW